VAVTDFHDVELSNDVAVHIEPVLLHLGDNSHTEVDSHQVEQLLEGRDVVFKLLNLPLKATNIVLVLEEGTDRLVSSLEVTDVLHSGLLLPIGLEKLLVKIKPHCARISYSLEVIELTLHPVVDVDESVADVGTGRCHLVLKGRVVGVVEHEAVGLHVHVVSEVDVFIVFSDLLEATHAVDNVRLVRQLNSEVHLHLGQERLDFLHEEVEVGDLGRHLIACERVVLLLVDTSGLLHAFIELGRSELRQVFKGLLDVGALRAGKRAEFI